MRPLRRPPVRRPVQPVPVRPIPRRPGPIRVHTVPPTSTTPEPTVTDPNLSSARAYILTSADWNGLKAITQAVHDRRDALNASIIPGQSVRLDGLLHEYLNGLTGAVESSDLGSESADIELDEASTSALRQVRGTNFKIPETHDRYVLRDVPFSACFPLS